MIKRLSLILLGCLMLAACSEGSNPGSAAAPATDTASSGAPAGSQTAPASPVASRPAAPVPQGGYQDGVDFQTLPRPVSTEDAGKIEIAEVFWYGCIHCYRLEPTLEEWVANLPEDVNFVPVPAIWHPTMELHARIFYASRALGTLEQTHWPTFQALNRNANALNSEANVLDFVEDLGIDPEQFRRAFSSFGVNTQVTQARSKAAGYGIRGTPEIIVEGKYRISTEMTGTQEKMLDVAAWLIERARQERNSGA